MPFVKLWHEKCAKIALWRFFLKKDAKTANKFQENLDIWRTMVHDSLP
ncbi:conserved hypothetical protein [delta proteobacterium NaphS2]|nr:conserved hypothetical protein [delta proteobacterium NaphS2]